MGERVLPMDTDNDGDGPAPSARGGSGGGSGGDLLQKIRAMRSDASKFLSFVDLAEQMIATHTDNKQDDEMVDGSLSTVLETLSDTHSALGRQLAQITTDCNTHRMAADSGARQWGAGGAVGPNETDNNAQQGRAVPDDDGGAKKRRRIDISPTAAAGGHSGGGSIAAGGAAVESQQQQRGATSLSADLAAPMQHSQQQQQQQQQQYPVWYVLAHRGSDFPLRNVLCLRETCSWARGLFEAPQLRQRLTHWTTDDELSAQAGLRRTANGQQLLTFDDQQMGKGDLLAALCVTEAGGWSEMSEAVELAGQCGNCQLPVRLTAGDLHQYPNKTAYSVAPRVLAQLKMVGPHIDFGNGVTFQLFQHSDTLRAIKDQDGFELTIDPPLLANHPYQQHRQSDDPPVRSRIGYLPPTGWVSLGAWDYSSVSSSIKRAILSHFERTHQTNGTFRAINRLVNNNRLFNLLTVLTQTSRGMHHHHIILLHCRWLDFSSSRPDRRRPLIRGMDLHVGELV
ncbi:unnamed protein product [Vitrella brassicaformis CCMP3155]|uniref:Uncharacterized protein n=1 Tax=Vitrella brassicaformis (strain CCMP3155) TaxID=1169540 RepID=A0A0G4FYY4_VITBC|nr:unnamed protein product [Vitrella brassicaformis CCMP3155]|eukprot:CEM20438.1 unnamed protein product [Vitrella brassicaformis CCMP3155]